MSGPRTAGEPALGALGEAWASLFAEAPTRFGGAFTRLWELTPAEQRDLGRATGQAAAAALERMLTARIADDAGVSLAADAANLAGPSAHGELALADGRTVEVFAAPLSDASGRPVGRTLFCRDVTRRRRDEAELRDWTRRLSAVVRLARVAAGARAATPLLQAAATVVAETLGVELSAVYELTPDGSQLVLRAGVGWPDSAYGMSLYATPSTTRVAVALLESGPLVAGNAGALGTGGELLASERVASDACALVRGRDRPYGVLAAYARSVRPFTRDELAFLETAAGVVGAALARQHAEDAVAERTRLVDAVFARAGEAIYVCDDEARILEANPAAAALLGLSPGELVGRSVLSFVRPEREEALRARWTRLLTDGRQEGEFEIPGAGDALRTVEYTAVTHVLPGQHLAVLRDVTARRRLAERLASTEKLSSLGRMAAGVAHELNNPLASVSANLGFAAETLARLVREVPASAAVRDADDTPVTDEMQRALEEARQGTERMRLIIRDLLALSRSDEGARVAVDLAEVVKTCVGMTRHDIRQHAALEVALEPVPRVLADPTALSQCLVHLLMNAAQAVAEAGPGAHRVRVASSVAPDGRVAVEVSDTGRGIAPEHLPRLFDPFFSTKPVGLGTGLGLSICHSIVRGYGGEIEVESTPGKGSTFRVLLPPASGSDSAPTANGDARA